MRPFISSRFPLAFALAVLAACSDAPATSEPQTDRTSLPANGAPPGSSSGLGEGTLGFSAREIPVGTSFLVMGPLVSTATRIADEGPITFSVRDPAVASWQGWDHGWTTIKAEGVGKTVLTVTGSTVRATIPITVLATTTAPTSVVVDDFYLLEVGEPGNWGYAPQFVLHDPSGQGGSAIIGFWFETPFGPTVRCKILRPIGARPSEVFHDSHGDFEFSFGGKERWTDADPVIAHVTLRIPGPFAKEITLKSHIVPGEWPPYRGGATEDVLTC